MARTTSSQRTELLRRIAAARQARSKAAAQPTVIDAQAQQAWRAVRQLTTMLPTFTAFARMATGNNSIRVQLGKQGAQTDGKTIWVFPPISLGEERVHDRHLCDKRGANKRQLCKACDARETVLFFLYHEIAHIAFESTAPPLQYITDRVIEMIREWHPAAACMHAKPMETLAERKPDYINLVSVHNQYLPILFNAIEDARVNAKMFRTRPGLKTMFEAGTDRVFQKGIELPDGTYQMWNEAPYNSQVIIGLFLIASGYGLPTGYLAEEVVDALRNPTILKLMDRVGAAYSVHQIAEISLDTFKLLNEMGFCLVPKCEVPPPIPSLPNEADDEESNANQEQSGSPQSDDDQADTCPGDSPDGDASEDGDSEAGDGGETDGGSSAGSSSESSGGSSEQAGHQQDAGDDEGSDDLGDEPAEADGSGESEENDIEPQNGSDGGDDSSSEEPGSDDDEDSASVDDALRGTGDIGNPSEGEDGAGSESSSSGAGDPHGHDGEDRDSEDSPGETGSSEDGEEDSPEDDDDDLEEEPGSGQSSAGSEDSADDDPEVDDGVRDVSENVWGDPEPGDGPTDQADVQPEARDYGSPADVADIIKIFGGHLPKDEDPRQAPDHNHFDEGEDHHHQTPDEKRREEAAVEKALGQSEHFESQRYGVEGLMMFEFPQPSLHWTLRSWDAKPAEYYPSEAIMGRALMTARLAFEANKRTGEVRNLKSGRIDGRKIGKRAPAEDPRMFKKKRRPEDKDYFFAIGVDISGSTQLAERNPRMLRAVFAQAQLLHRLGHRFAIYGMSGGRDPENLGDFDFSKPDSVWVLEVKTEADPWSEAIQNRLAGLRPTAENFDGHNIEFLRKVLDRSNAISKGIIYYTDGAMPAANADEELVVLTNELLTCKKKGYAVLGVGINTDSPRQYGLDTVQIDCDEDLVKVTTQLGNFLTKN